MDFKNIGLYTSTSHDACAAACPDMTLSQVPLRRMTAKNSSSLHHLHVYYHLRRSWTLTMPVLVLDNGAYNIKCGYASDGLEGLVKEYNAITFAPSDRRTFIGSQVHSQVRDFSRLQFRRPVERGHLVNWEGQKAIWDNVFYGKSSPLASDGQGVDPSETSLILTEMPFQLPALSAHMDQIVFEEYGFESYYRCTPASLVPWNNISDELYKTPKRGNLPVADCSLVIDSGFSATHIVPVIYGEVYWAGVKRINVGGKMLTNYLRETCSFRYYDMSRDTYIMNEVKEATCFVSQDFAGDIEECRKDKKHLLQRYALPALSYDKGRVLGPNEKADVNDAILSLTNERFTVPETLFNPGLIDLEQAGIAETAIRCVNDVPEEARSLLLSNVVLTGGSTNLPGYKERVARELRAMTPQNWPMRVGTPKQPDCYAFKGGCELGEQPEMLERASVTKEEYLEHGVNLCLRKFGLKKGEAFESS